MRAPIGAARRVAPIKPVGTNWELLPLAPDMFLIAYVLPITSVIAAFRHQHDCNPNALEATGARSVEGTKSQQGDLIGMSQ